MDMGKVKNTLSNGGAGGGLGSSVVNENAPLIKERPTFWLDQQEVDRRGHARDSGVANRRMGQTGGNIDVGGR